MREEKTVEYNVIVYNKGWKDKHYVTVTLTDKQNKWLVFWELMQKYNCKKFRADCKCKLNELPSEFRWCYFN